MNKPKKFHINLAVGSELHDLRARLFTEFDKAGTAKISSLIIDGGKKPEIVVNYSGVLSEAQKRFIDQHSSIECV